MALKLIVNQVSPITLCIFNFNNKQTCNGLLMCYMGSN